MKRADAALIRAIQAGDAQTVETLLVQGVDPNMTDVKGQPAILLITQAPVTASIHGMTQHGECHSIEKHKNHAAIVRLLVQHGANVNVKNADGWTPLLQAKAAEETELAAFLKRAEQHIRHENGL